ncbi:MAG: flavodoxin domain-containing protein [Candidatus Firestonebacteria bacterium]
MSAVKVIPGVYSVGAVDWNVRAFHGHTYNTRLGTTYNSYLIVDEKIALIDTVYAPFSAQLLKNIAEIVPLDKIDYVISNHGETDHSGSLPEIKKACPRAKHFGTQKCKEILQKMYYLDLDFTVVKSGDKLSLGKKTLSFLEAPMIHWPDSMFTYIQEDALLLSNDAFGQHYASSQRFNDEVEAAPLMEEAEAYFANILWPLSPLILRKIEEVVKAGFPIKIIAPSHGVIWRKDPMKIVNAYVEWAKNTTRKKVVIAYETMWKSTEKMAYKIADGLISEGIEVKLYDVSVIEHTNIIREMLYAKGFIVGSSTLDNDMLPNAAKFLYFLKGLRPKGRIGAAFGSYGWAGGAVKTIEGVLKETGVELVLPGLGVQFVPDKEEEKKCFDFGKEFARKL